MNPFHSLPVLSIMILLPVIATLLLAVYKQIVKTEHPGMARWLAFITMTLDLLIAIVLVLSFDHHNPHMQFIEEHLWIPDYQVYYRLGIDGISLLMVFLTTLVGWVAVLASWRSITVRVEQFMACLLLMQALMLGVFCALDLLLFYLFWEAMLIPMYLLIGIWGGDNRFYATIKFFLYTLAGSILFLLGIIALYFYGNQSLNILTMDQLSLDPGVQRWLFIAFFFGFAVKVPMFPFHTWLPDAHVQAPTAGSIILAGILLKMGAYGFIRFSLPIFPEASHFFAPLMSLLSVIAIIYGGLLALAQDDLKKLVAYSSISHMGFVTLGLFMFNHQGIAGAVLQMFNHGIVTSALFLMVGLLYERTHSRSMRFYSGLMKLLPVYTLCFAVFVLASMALPGTSSFIGELYILAGAFQTRPMMGALAILGAGLSAIYLLRMYRKVALGTPENPKLVNLADINLREGSAIGALILFVFWIGLHPLPFIELITPNIELLLQQLDSADKTMAWQEGVNGH